ncbi:hypothetical protein CVM52_25650, partial [Pseudooceanicola lipolyticus]
LGEFLSDQRVIDYPRWKWQPLLQLIMRRVWPARADLASGANATGRAPAWGAARINFRRS